MSENKHLRTESNDGAEETGPDYAARTWLSLRPAGLANQVCQSTKSSSSVLSGL